MKFRKDVAVEMGKVVVVYAVAIAACAAMGSAVVERINVGFDLSDCKRALEKERGEP